MPMLASVHLALLLAAQAPRPSSQPSYVHESWTVKDGLPVNSINAILQDRTGYIWIATFDGLVRFDGVRFTVFNATTSPKLPSNRIAQLQEGHNGTLWVQTVQGNIVRFRDGQFANLPLENGTTTGRLSNLMVDSAGIVWVGYASGSIPIPERAGHSTGRPKRPTPTKTISLWQDGPSAAHSTTMCN